MKFLITKIRRQLYVDNMRDFECNVLRYGVDYECHEKRKKYSLFGFRLFAGIRILNASYGIQSRIKFRQ